MLCFKKRGKENDMEHKKFLYEKVYERIAKDIQESALCPGEKLRTEEELAQEYNVSIITIKKAMDRLKQEDFVRRVPGVGTFVTDRAAFIPSDVRLDKGNRLIGVILEHITSPFGLSMLYAMDQSAAKNGFRLIIRFSYTDQQTETDEIDFLTALGVEGLIIMPSHAHHYNTRILRMVVEGFPVILIDKKLEGVPVASVYTDNAAAMDKIILEFTKKGHKHIGLISTPPQGISSVMQRQKGFAEAMKKYGLEYNDRFCVLNVGLDLTTTRSNMRKNRDNKNTEALMNYLNDNPELTALAVLEYGLMADTVYVLKKLGRRIPEDISIICFDEDYEHASEYFFTHIKQDEAAIGVKAIELMVGFLNEKKAPTVKSYRIAPFFLEGGSVSDMNE